MTVVVFKSKTEVFAFLEDMKYYSAGAVIVGMPKEIKIGCGFCVKITDSAINLAKRLVYGGEYSTFYGIFKIKRQANTTSLTKIY